MQGRKPRIAHATLARQKAVQASWLLRVPVMIDRSSLAASENLGTSLSKLKRPFDIPPSSGGLDARTASQRANPRLQSSPTHHAWSPQGDWLHGPGSLGRWGLSRGSQCAGDAALPRVEPRLVSLIPPVRGEVAIGKQGRGCVQVSQAFVERTQPTTRVQ
jgi:hypothetical protein